MPRSRRALDTRRAADHRPLARAAAIVRRRRRARLIQSAPLSGACYDRDVADPAAATARRSRSSLATAAGGRGSWWRSWPRNARTGGLGEAVSIWPAIRRERPAKRVIMPLYRTARAGCRRCGRWASRSSCTWLPREDGAAVHLRRRSARGRGRAG